MVDRGVGDIIGDGISNGVDIDSGAVGDVELMEVVMVVEGGG